MTTSTAEVGEHYLRRTIYESTEFFTRQPVEEHPEVSPPAFKIYRNLPRYRLGGGLPLRLADARRCAAGPPSTPRWDEATVSALTHYGYGVSRRDEGPGVVWPVHRQVASARCLFPTELYLWIPQTGDVPGGLHHYDPLHHALVQLRDGDLRDDMADAVGACLDGCRVVLLVSSMLWKNAYKYHGYAYRLCSQEAGMVVGNCLLVAAALGLRGTVHHRFADGALAHLLGLDSREEGVFAALALGDGPGPRAGAPPGGREPRSRPPLPPLDTSFAGMETFGGALDPLLTGIAERSAQDRPRAGRDGPAPVTGGCAEPTSTELPGPGRSGRNFDLAAALRARSSGNVMLGPLRAPLSVADLGEVLHPLLQPWDCDLRPEGAGPPIDVLVAAVDIEGLAPDCYRYCPHHGALHPLGTGDVVRRLQGSMSVPNLNLCASNAVVYLAGDMTEALRTHGDRGYRILTMEAGVLAQRLSVLAAACGLVARVHNGYDATEVERALGIESTPLTPLFQVALAHNRPGVQYGLRVLF